MQNSNELKDQQWIHPSHKGFAFLEESLSFTDALSKQWNILNGDLLFPLLSIEGKSLEHNIACMAEFTSSRDILLAPHAKTTMSPEIISKQIEAGCWALTAATLSQAIKLIQMGCQRIILANSILDSLSIKSLLQCMKRNVEFYCFVDSIELVEEIEKTLQDSDENLKIQLFVEMGIPGHRTGCRDIAYAKAIINKINKAKHSVFSGLSGYEGLIKGPRQKSKLEVEAYLKTLFQLANDIQDDFSTFDISLGGSAYFDLVYQNWQNTQLRNCRLILRPGSYITHDHGHYARVQEQRESIPTLPTFKPALTLWSKIQSLPEEGLAILNMGRRDVAMEAEFPIPLQSWRPTDGFSNIEHCEIFKTNDQHSYMRIPENHNFHIGDVILSGVSHPSLAFDKWKVIPMIDERTNIVEFCHTCF